MRRFVAYAFAILLCWLTLPQPLHAQDPEEDLNRLAARINQAGKVDSVRIDLLAYQKKYGGTIHAVKAAALLRDLPSPLDSLQASAIPEVERFSWHPKETVAILGEHKGRQAGAVTCILFDRKGKLLVSGSTNGHVRLWDPVTMRLQQIIGHSAGAYSLAFTKDNSVMAHGGGDGQVHRWNMTGEKPKDLGLLKIASGALFSIAFSPSGKWLLVGGSDSRAYLWDLTLDPPREHAALDGPNGPVRAVSFSATGTLFAGGGDDKMIRIWTIVGQNAVKEKFSLDGHGAAVNSLAFHPTEDTQLISGGADGSVKVWTVGTKFTLRNVHKGKNGAVNSVAYSTSGKTIAAAYADGTVRTFTLGANLVEKSVMEGHKGSASAVAFSPDLQNLASGSSDWTVRLWPAVAGPKPRDKTVKVGHLSHVYTTAFNPEGTGLASGSYDATARFWELAGSPEPKERTPNMKGEGYIYTLAFSPDGKNVVAGGASAVFKTYDVAKGNFIFGFPGHKGNITKLDWSPDGTTIASCSNDKTIQLWDPKTGKSNSSITNFETFVNSVAFAPDGKRLLCSSGYYLYDDKGRIVVRNSETIFKDSTVRLYDLGSLKETYRWQTEKSLMGAVAFSPDGKTVFAGSSDVLLREFDAVKLPKEPDVFYKGGTSGISMLTCSPDGRYLLTYGPDYRISLFDIASKKKLKDFVMHEQYGSVAFAPDSRHIAIGVGTGVVYLLRLEEAKK